MTIAQITLTDSQTDALHELSRRTGKTEDELVQEAVNRLIIEVGESETSRQRRLKALRAAAGMWKDRTDLPNFEKMRKEWDRFSPTLD